MSSSPANEAHMLGRVDGVGPTPPAEFLAAVLATSDDAIFSHDPHLHITTWNPAAERLFGYPAPSVLGRSSVDLFPTHEREAIADLFDTVMAGDHVSHHEAEVRRRDGMPMPISLSVCPVHDTTGALVCSVLIARDITEQRVAQATLAEIEARVHESEALANVGSWLWDLHTGTVQWSDEFYRIHDVVPLDFDGTFEAHLHSIHPDDRARVRGGLEQAVAANRAFDDLYRIVRPDGKVREVRARAQPTVDAAGTVVALRGIGQDVTDRPDAHRPARRGA